MGVGSWGQESVARRKISYMIHGISYVILIKLDGGLMVLFFGLVFSVASPPENFSADALDYDKY